MKDIDQEYNSNGAILQNSAKEVLAKSEIILKVNIPSDSDVNLIKDKSIIIGQFDPNLNKETINKLIKKMDINGIEHRRGSAGGGNQTSQPYLKKIIFLTNHEKRC